VQPNEIQRPSVFSRRQLLVSGGVLVGTLGLLDQLEGLAWLPQRYANAATMPDTQFDLTGFTAGSQTIDGIVVSMPPIHTVFLTGRLSRTPSRADQQRMENALLTIEGNYPYSAGGIITHVSYSDNYFARLPSSLVNANMPRTLAGNLPVLQRAAASPTDVAPGSRVLALRRAEFNVPLQLESNDVLFTVRGDNSTYVGDVVSWLSGSNRLKGAAVTSPRFDAGLTITSSRAMFVQMGLPRNIAFSNNLPFESYINPFSPMWMGFADQQVNASSPAADVTFVGGHGIKLTNATAGSYFDNGAIQHLSHVLLDLQQFYVDGNSQDESDADHREPYEERIQYMFTSPAQLAEAADNAFLDGGGPRSLGTRGAFVQNVFSGADQAQRNAAQLGRVGHLDGLHRSGRTSDGRPIHLRIDGPGFDTMDTTTGRNTAKLQFSAFFPSADFFATLRRNQASVVLLDQFNLEEEDHGLERFTTATRRQNFLIPPRRHRAFPLIELT
jgi:hypothetical protein